MSCAAQSASTLSAALPLLAPAVIVAVRAGAAAVSGAVKRLSQKRAPAPAISRQATLA